MGLAKHRSRKQSKASSHLRVSPSQRRRSAHRFVGGELPPTAAVQQQNGPQLPPFVQPRGSRAWLRSFQQPWIHHGFGVFRRLLRNPDPVGSFTRIAPEWLLLERAQLRSVLKRPRGGPRRHHEGIGPGRLGPSLSHPHRAIAPLDLQPGQQKSKVTGCSRM